MTAPTSLVLLADVKEHLNIGTVDAARDAKLQEYVDAVTPVIEDIIGHVVAASFVESYDAGDVSIYVRELPLLTVESLVEQRGFVGYTLTLQPVGAPVDAYGYSIDDLASGKIVRRSAGSTPIPFGSGNGNRPFTGLGKVLISYTAGRATVPSNVALAAKELVRHLWQMGQQGNRILYGGAADDSLSSPTPSGFLIPNRVRELLGGSPRPVVIS